MKRALAALTAPSFTFSANAKAMEKPPVVLVHGAFENAQVWDHVTAKFHADGDKVVAVDLPGHTRRTRRTRQGRIVRFRTRYRDALSLAKKFRAEFQEREIGDFTGDAKDRRTCIGDSLSWQGTLSVVNPRLTTPLRSNRIASAVFGWLAFLASRMLCKQNEPLAERLNASKESQDEHPDSAECFVRSVPGASRSCWE